MFTKKALIATTAAAGIALSPVANAQEVTLEDFVGLMLEKAVAEAQYEIQNNVHAAVLTAGLMFDIEESEEVYIADVQIKDLKEQDVQDNGAE